MKFAVLLIALSGLWLSATAQTTGGKAQNELNMNVIPPSPEAAQLGRYVEIPVGTYTGTPDISIPITTLKDGPLSVGVSLSYHAGGNRVEDIAGWTGLGWTLNAGGAITRVTRGVPDDFSGATIVRNFAQTRQQYTYQQLLSAYANAYDPDFTAISNGQLDTEPDHFLFNFNGYTGKFMFDWSGNLVVSCNKRIKVKDIRDPNATNPLRARIIGWEITVDDGTVYKFYATEITSSRQSGSNCGPTGAPCYDFTSTWYLTEIVDVNQERRINFSYNNLYTLYYTQPYSMSEKRFTSSGDFDISIKIKGLNWTIFRYAFSGLCSPGVTTSNVSTQLLTRGLHLSKITSTTANHHIEFINGAARTDTEDLIMSGAPKTENFFSLGKIVEKDRNGLEKRSHNFSYDNTTGRLTLKSISELVNGVSQKPPHQFGYITTPTLPSIRSYSQDHWGFYNGEGNPDLLPTYQMVYQDGYAEVFNHANREPNTTKAQAGILNSIVYPTGGKVEFDYEGNEYSFIQDETLQSKGFYKTVGKTENVLAIGTGSRVTNKKTIQITANPNRPSQKVILKITYNYRTTAATPLSKPYIRISGVTPFSKPFTAYDGYYQQFYSEDGQIATATITQYKSFTPGIYELEASAKLTENVVMPDFANITVEYEDFATEIITKRTCGGLRIKEIREYTEPVKKPTEYQSRQYDYNLCE
jgi:hypothetical protein